MDESDFTRFSAIEGDLVSCRNLIYLQKNATLMLKHI